VLGLTPSDALTPADGLEFVLPSELEAHEPPEARGLGRDQVRLLVSQLADDRVEHHRFVDLPDLLRPGDLVVANDSATVPAALGMRRADGSQVTVHVSTRLQADLWVVEPRHTSPEPGQVLTLVSGPLLRDAEVTLRLLAPHAGSRRLWVGQFAPAALDVRRMLQRYGRPIAYPYVSRPWPISMYQTIYAGPPGSAEMPSAGRAFSPDVLEHLQHRGVQFATLTLHTGVASLEGHERPYAEEYWIPACTAAAVRAARSEGRRVIAVGTTVVRALESAADEGDGEVIASHAWTDLVITPRRGVRVVDSLLTGFHEPKASHLAMLEAIAGRHHLEVAYAAALQGRYLWHEFGDLHLILSGGQAARPPSTG
jgi:S-adenosylmethionine:tRNA ribosyltransferase-isomerase